jgi:hypothetical protein
MSERDRQEKVRTLIKDTRLAMPTSVDLDR